MLCSNTTSDHRRTCRPTVLKKKSYWQWPMSSNPIPTQDLRMISIDPVLIKGGLLELCGIFKQNIWNKSAKTVGKRKAPSEKEPVWILMELLSVFLLWYPVIYISSGSQYWYWIRSIPPLIVAPLCPASVQRDRHFVVSYMKGWHANFPGICCPRVVRRGITT